MHSSGQEALLEAAATAGLTGFLLWVTCVLVVRAVSRIALNPYHALADRLDRIVDGEADDLADLHGPVVGVRRLARAVFIFHDRALASRRSEAILQAKYDALYQEHADERRLLMTMLTGRLESATDRSLPLRPEAAGMAEFEIPGLPETGIAPANPTQQPAQVIDLSGRFTRSKRPQDDGGALASSAELDFGSLELAIARR